MCSTRRTSPSAELGAGASCAPGGASAMDRAPPHPLDVDVDRHRDDDRDADVEVEVVGARALDDQAVVEDPKEQRTDQRPDDGAGAAGEEGPADHRGGDSREEEYVCGRGV